MPRIRPGHNTERPEAFLLQSWTASAGHHYHGCPTPESSVDRVIEYCHALASPWSYLGNDLLRSIAAHHGATVDPITVDYDRVFTAAGTVPLLKRPPLRRTYRLIEFARWSGFRGVTLNPEPHFYRGEMEEPHERQGALMVTAAQQAGLDSLRLAHGILRALWAEERFPFRTEEFLAIAPTEGFDGDGLLAGAASCSKNVSSASVAAPGASSGIK